MKENNPNRQVYWEKNIKGFSGFYETKSEENIQGLGIIVKFYKYFIFPIEKVYMKERYALVQGYIDSQLKSGMKFADIGCGSGIFLKHAINKGANVFAFDYTDAAIELAQMALTPQEREKVVLAKMDITKQNIPKVDSAIAIGVLPYITDIEQFFANTLPYTDSFLFNYIDADNIVNKLRSKFEFLNVRNIVFHSSKEIEGQMKKNNFRIRNKVALATGFMIQGEVEK